MNFSPYLSANSLVCLGIFEGQCDLELSLSSCTLCNHFKELNSTLFAYAFLQIIIVMSKNSNDT